MVTTKLVLLLMLVLCWLGVPSAIHTLDGSKHEWICPWIRQWY